MTNTDTQTTDLPKGWVWTELHQISLQITDGSHNPPAKQPEGLPMLSAKNIENDHIIFDDFRYISPEDFEIECKRAIVEENDVLLTIVGSIGRSSVVPKGVPKFTLQRSVALIKPIGVNSKYLSFCFQSPTVQNLLAKTAKGTAQKGIYLNSLRELKILLPPLAEQYRIVAKIEELFSDLEHSIAALETAQAQLKIYRQAVLKYAFEGKLTEQWRAARKDLTGFENLSGLELLSRIQAERAQNGKPAKSLPPLTEAELAELPSLPKGWVWGKLEQLADAIDPQPSHRTPPEVDNGVPYIGIGEIDKQTGKIDFENARKVSKDVLQEHIAR